MSGPLSGVRVLDLSSVVMGPWATQLMGDLGADVISVEDQKGDTNRYMGVGPHPKMSGVAMNLLRNKRNVCLDLKHPEGRLALLCIAATCDVMITNLRPGPLKRLGLSYVDICSVRPDIVFCQAQGWPSDSPDAERPAYDDIVQTATGIADLMVTVTGEARMLPTIVADKVSGLTILYSVLAALFHRERTGEGQHIEVPMVEAMSAFVLAEHGAGAIPEPPLTPAGYPRILTPERKPHRTTDGWIAILPYSARHYELLLTEGGRAELLDDERVKSERNRILNAGFLYRLVANIVRDRSTGFWVGFCERNDIPCSPVVSVQALVDALPLAEHDQFGPYRQIGHGARWSTTKPSVRRHAAMPGQHDDEVLLEVGYRSEEVDALRRSGALPYRRRALDAPEL